MFVFGARSRGIALVFGCKRSVEFLFFFLPGSSADLLLQRRFKYKYFTIVDNFCFLACLLLPANSVYWQQLGSILKGDLFSCQSIKKVSTEPGMPAWMAAISDE